MAQENIAGSIRKIFEEVFPELKNKEFDFEKKQEQFESWDSFSHMEIISAVEQHFKINLETEEVVSIDSPRKLVEIIEKKIQK